MSPHRWRLAWRPVLLGATWVLVLTVVSIDPPAVDVAAGSVPSMPATTTAPLELSPPPPPTTTTTIDPVELEWAAARYAAAVSPPPPPPPPPPPTTRPTLALPSGSAQGGGWARLRNCESSGNYRAISPGGAYRGAYQFDYQTWHSVGGVGDPAAASPAEQDYRAQLLYNSRGSQPWPVCGRYLR